MEVDQPQSQDYEFEPATLSQTEQDRIFRSVSVPQHRLTPLRKHWDEIYTPLTEHMKLQVRMNTYKQRVELRTSEYTKDPASVQKGADFVNAFILGFELRDAIALLRLDDLFVESFDIKDVKTLHGEHLSRAIGRIAGQSGKTKFTIENATRTRIVLADTRIHLMGSYSNIRIARSALVRLIRGTPPSKVYTQMKAVSSRMKERY